jgi:hypothetical protein
MTMVYEWFGLKTTQMVFTGLASKPVATVSGGLTSKPDVTVSDDLASKPATTVFYGLASKTVATVFSSLTSKLVATVSLGLASKPVVSFLIEHQNQGGGRFLDFGLKTNSYGLVIWASKSPLWFFGLGIKTKRTSVCQLHHKTDGWRLTRDTRQDLVACFTWKQVWLGFFSLA